MNDVVAPISPGDSGPHVAHLQGVLAALVARNVLELSGAEREHLELRFQDEIERETFGPATQALVFRFRVAMQLGEADDVDIGTATALNTLLSLAVPATQTDDDRRIVRGRVIGAGPGHRVRAYDKDMRSEEVLGEAGVEGEEYEIAYSRTQFARAEKDAADLRVTVLNRSGREVASTPIIFNAGTAEMAPDLVVSTGLSEYERLTAELEPLVQGVAFEDLTDDDIAFLHGETGVDAEWIGWLADAARRSRESSADPEHGDGSIPASAFYGLFRKDVSPDRVVRTTLDTLRAALEAAAAESIVPPWTRKQLHAILGAIQALQVDASLTPSSDDEPPSMGDVLAALPTRLTPGQEAAVAAAAGPGGIGALREEHLDDLVRRDELTRDEAEHVALAAVTFHLTGGDAAITRGVLGLTEGRSGPRVRTVDDLARLDEEDWEEALAAVGVKAPAGMTRKGFARELTGRVARVLPSDFLAYRVTAVPENLTTLVGDGKDKTPEPLVRLARRNPGLRLEEVLAGRGAARTKAKKIERLVGLVADTWSLNPGKNLLELDHSPDSADLDSLELPDASDDDRERILSNLRAHQRAYRAGRGAATGLKLLDAGFDASRKIVALNLDEFVEASGLPPQEAVAAHYAATRETTAAATKSIALYQLAHAHAPGPARTAEETLETFVKIPGYSTLFPDDFGFCDCDECCSVLGLPAYFVDTMFFVEKHILDYIPTNLSFHLRARRDDLWTLDLTCENANEVVAYLDVVNEILEKHVSSKLGLAQGGDVWQRIAAKNPSFALPFNLPLTRIETYLGHFGKRRLDAAVACGSDEPTQARARLGLSQVESDMIASPSATSFTALTAAEMSTLSKLYGYLEVYQNGTVETSGFSIVFVANLVDVTGASREQLGELLATDFVGGSKPPTIRAGRQSAQSLQNDTEVVEGLKAEHLDRLHRFYRLSRQLPWTIPELDRTLGRLADSGVSTGLGDRPMLRIARLLAHHEELGDLSVEELCGLWTEIPNDAIEGKPGLFDSLFNPPQLASLGTPLAYTTSPQGSFQHPSFNTTGTSVPQDENTLARLLAGLRLSDEELVRLLLELAVPLGLGPDRKLALSIHNITLLYRHARLARCLGLTVSGLFQLFEAAELPLQTSGGQSARYVRDWSLSGTDLVDDIETVLDGHRWASQSPFAPDEIAFITGGTVADEATLVSGEKRADAEAVVEAVLTELIADGAFEFADTALSGMPNGAGKTITEDQSRRIVGASAALFETPAGRTTLRLKKEPTAADITLPAPATEFAITEAEVAAELAKHSVQTLLPPALAKALDFSIDKTTELLRLSGQDATLTSNAFRTSLTGVLYGTSTDRTDLLDLVTALAPYAVLYRDDLYDSDALDAIYQDQATFAVDVQPLTPEAVRLASLFTRLATGPDPGFATTAPPADVPAALEAVNTGAATVASDVLARALRTDAARIDALRPHVTAALPANGLDALEMLASCLALTALLGISGETLSDLALTPGTGTEYERLRKAADALFAAFRTKYGSDDEFRVKIEPYEDTLRSRKRDGLVGFIRFSEPARFPLESDLYEYFLLDVQVEGCTRTTRIAAAIFSLQLYVHRVLMHLERTETYDVGENARIPRDEWDWRRHFRTWQAARRVFLYPESYLEPGLRDDKTPLFRELEDTLLQQQVTEQNVRDGYASYLAGFDELAGLRIAAACWQPGDSLLDTPDVVHLFGVTSSEPPIYYYRTVSGVEKAAETKSVEFAPWRKLDLQIGAKTCSPAVHNGTLYLFWAEVATRPKTSLVNGSSKFIGYLHKLALKYSALRLDGRWSAPQRLRIVQQSGETDSIEITDRLVGADTPASLSWQAAINAIRPLLTNPNLNDQQKAEIQKVIDDYQQRAKDAMKYTAMWDPLARVQTEPLDDYTLVGARWHPPYPFSLPSGLRVYAGGNSWIVDVFRRTATDESSGYTTQPVSSLALYRDSSTGQLLGLRELTQRMWENEYAESSVQFADPVIDAPSGRYLTTATAGQSIEVVAVNGDPDSAVVTVGKDAFYVRMRDGAFGTVRLGSTIADGTAETLVSSASGLERVLGADFQVALEESPLPLVMSGAGTGTQAQQIGFLGPGGPGRATERVTDIDYDGAVGDYYREIWCHVPWVIADYLHSQGRYSDAKRWYEAIFDPAARNVPSANPEYKRVWQFREFRREPVESLRTALSRKAELTAYASDPFSPHAIARLRPGAYEKAMVMQYVDNLLDWGDSLFTLFTAESINEATMLYILALDILGPRALDAGECTDELHDRSGRPIKKDYDHLAPALRTGHEFVIDAENLFVIEQLEGVPSHIDIAVGVAYSQSALEAGDGGLPTYGDGPIQPYGWQQAAPQYWSVSGGTPLGELQLGTTVDGANGFYSPTFPDVRTLTIEGDPLDPPMVGLPELPEQLERGGFSRRDLETQPGLSLDDRLNQIPDTTPPVNAKPWQLLDSSIAFCVPDNKELRAYWDRVEGRLFNIRNCRDIDGTLRRPELFGPEIDPRLLIKLKAAGLTLDDVLNVTSGNVPPYRFTYLLEKARQYASAVESFGGALLSALEKRDGETLANLRTTHEQHLLKLRTQVQELEIKAAEQTRDGLLLQQQAAEYRRDYARGLSQTGLNAWERTQQVSRHLVTSLHEIEAIVQLVRAVLSLLPQLGAPTAMKYGGMETSGAASGFASASQALAQAAEAASASAGLEATFQRRDDEWKQQAALAQRDVDQLTKQVAAAEIRIQMAERSLEVHNKTIEQTEELYQFSKDRFTSLGLYTFLSTTLQRLYRDAYNSAFSMALLAEQAYRFERPADRTTALGRDYWDQSLGGLLAGERLLLDLQALERRYLETDYRQLEIEQSFSLAQFDPAALAALRETGECTFKVPELFFDLAYPGHYLRRVKAVRLSLPCVVGPYANASATLKQLDSELRLEPTGSPVPAPPRHSVSIAASSAQNDGGVFEFNFRDERYMPFEGSGAVSSWQLSLPKAFRLFDYGTISDVVLRISYTAESDEMLRQTVDDALGTVASALGQRLKTDGLPLLLSLRRDLPDVWRKLVTTPTGTDVAFTIDERHLPVLIAGWLGGRALRDMTPAKKPKVSVVTKSILLDASEKPGAGFGLTAKAGAGAASTLGFVNRGADGLFSAPFAKTVSLDPAVSTDLKLVFKVTGAGNFAPPATPASAATVDETKFRDVMILATLKIAT